jgi:hypothetical protein
VYSICGDYICRSIQVLNKWYQSTFLGRHCGQIFFIFADFFFRRRKKRAATFQKFWYISVKNLQKQVVYLSSSQKNTQVEKKNRLKRSPGSQDIEVLKSAIFQGFFRGRRRDFFFYFCSSWRPNLPKQITYLSSSHNFTQFQKTNQPKRSPGSEVMSILNSTVFQGFSGKRRDFLQ